jgi:hypothetical protein
VTDLGWTCTDCKYEGAPRETRTCPRCNGKMDTTEERELIARKARLADSVEEVCHCGAFFSTVNTITGQPHCDGPAHHPLPASPHESDEHTVPDKRKRLAELLGTDSTNFLGTGLTLREFMQLHDAEKLAASWTLQPTEERKRRRRTIIQLSIELGRLREVTEFSTGLAELAIEAVIEGDWKMVTEWAEHFTFDEERDELRQRYAPAFAVFRELLLQALRAQKEPPT